MPTTERDSSNSFVIACHDAGLGLAHEKHHGKIIRGNALRIAFTVYGRQEEADILIEQMTRDQDPILRYGDVSDDVRRIVVLAIGFVLYSEPEQTPRIVSLLSESYNPHIRYGALIAMAKVMVKINASSDSRVGTFKQQLEKIILDKHEDV
ncbi:unnamed protein product, partial [Vitis vinifera]